VTDQFVAIAVESREPGRSTGERLTLCVFDAERTIAETTVELELGTGKRRQRDSDSGSERAAAIRALTGRTTIVASPLERRTVSALGLADDGIVELSDVAAALYPNLHAQSLPDLTAFLELPFATESGAAAVVACTRRLWQRVEEYDTPTLAQIVQLALVSGWAAGALFAAVLRNRTERPLLNTGVAPLGSHELAFLASRERPDPLKRTGSTKGIRPEGVASLLEPGGELSKVLPGFERRRSQQQMAEAVASTLNDDGWLLVEAGTGTGKSMAYLAPAARFAIERGERVVISTNTKALQDQLMQKDIPSLQEAMATIGDDSIPLRASVLKGRANYVCLRRWFAHDKQPVAGPTDAGMRARVHLWLPATETGDRAELGLRADEEPEFGRVSAEGEACLPARCVYQQRNQCFLFRARREAESAHLVVVNHALLLSDTSQGAAILPEYERLIVDEAHHLEDQATSQFGITVGEGAVGDAIDPFARAEGALTVGFLTDAAALLAKSAFDERSLLRANGARDQLAKASEAGNRSRAVSAELFALLKQFCREGGSEETGYGRTMRVTPAMRRTPAWTQVEIEFDRLNAALNDVEGVLRWFLGALHEGSPAGDGDEAAATDPFESIAIEVGAGIQASMDLGAQMAEIVLAPLPEQVYWISLAPITGRASLNSAPLNIGDLLRASVVERMRSVVLTSATLTTDGSFDYIKQRLAFGEAEELSLPSPFDYERSTLLYIADDVPEPNQPGYQRAVEAAIMDLAIALDGRTLALFTSHAALRLAHQALKQPLADAGITLLAQRADGSPRQLIERLKTSSRTMLLGTATFWEGIDVVGPALSALVIAKLPFGVPTDPIYAARSEAFESPFVEYAVPQAVLRFKQGFGRLIRSSSDRGVCVVLDRRVVSKRYGASFVQSLPSCSVRVGATGDVGRVSRDWVGGGPELNNEERRANRG